MIQSDRKDVNPSKFKAYIRQQPNSKWLSLFRVPLVAPEDTLNHATKWSKWLLNKIGEKPVLFDSTQTRLTSNDFLQILSNMGYLKAEVEVKLRQHKKKMDVTYLLHPGDPYFIDSVAYDIRDTAIANLLAEVSTRSSTGGGTLHTQNLRGKQFSVEGLDNERNQITAYLLSTGYYKFHKDFIAFDADSSAKPNSVFLRMKILPFHGENGKAINRHPCYSIKEINYANIDKSPIPLRQKVLQNSTLISINKPFDNEDLQKTYSKFAKLGAVRYANITFREHPDTTLLDCNILLQMNKKHLLSLQPEGTNTAGDLGAAMTLAYENLNLFRGSEHLTLQFRGAYEAIKGLEGYQNHKYEEYGVEANLQIPRFLSPFLSKSFKRRSNATSEITLSYNLQNRPEFHRRYFTTSWRYRWSEPHHHIRYRFDLVDLSYIYMPWISSTFKHDYLDSVSNRNAILRYNYENLLIMKVGFGVAYNNGTDAIKGNIETAGNLLQLSSPLFRFGSDNQGRHIIFNTAYAQYLKLDLDYTRLFFFDKRNNLAIHLGLGVAWPYGNSKVLPFEKRYFAGGPNSVRGWSVRELGPGGFKGKDRRIDFINQTGDMKLDVNLEYRTWLFWKFDGALFVDAGNIWTLRNYADQPDGQFKLDTFYKQIALSYGLGLRLNFSYFILRFDAGMKAINPAYDSTRKHYAILHPDFKRDFTFHFAVGLPF
nr:BamA/TamA family outer membrane protein [Prevotella sp. oral taxon 820]